MPKGLDNRSRDEDGEIRHKRNDTLVRTVEAEYGVDLGLRGDAKLKTALEQHDVPTLSKLIEKVRKDG